MFVIPEYQINKTLYKSRNSIVYQAMHKTEAKSVIVKAQNKQYPTLAEIARFKHEYEMTKDLTITGIPRMYGLEDIENRLVIISEDFGGQSLNQLIKDGVLFDLPDFLTMAIQITHILGQIHQHHIIHKDINPANIIFNPESKELKIIDFGIATRLSRENPTVRNPDVLEGTLAYISPEQTGRMNRAIDYRTDFYSLGVTFYQLLTGKLPFVAEDAMALVHAHIAQKPTPPHVHNSAIPQTVSNIILKLLSKTAENRYQSTYGLKMDLETCLKQWQNTNKIESFEIGHHDIATQLQIPQKLYGRDQEIETLLTAFNRASQAKSELVLVSGYAGIGKTMLVNEVHKPIVQKRGYFISGKFEQFQRNTPYSALIKAFQDLIRQFLTEGETGLAIWRDKLLTALGPNGQVIIDVIPEVELIVGPQPDVPDLDPAERQNRFNLVLQQFITIFTQKEHPLVIFLDDLQWADSASLNLIELLMSDPDSHHLFLIGAYRDNEVDTAHPLTLTINNIQEKEGLVQAISLTPLTLTHIQHLLHDTLAQSLTTVEPLAQLILTKTNGNPFFVNQFLTLLYQEEVLVFDPTQQQWQWEVSKIEAMGITDNVVDLMRNKIKKLSPDVQQVLQLASCIGNQFNLDLLTHINQKTVLETANLLWEAIQEGLILPIGDAYKFLQADNQTVADDLAISYQFLHDRVQQAAYALIDPDHKQQLHLKIGHLIQESIDEQEQTEHIFDIVSHLNFGRDLITDPTEKEKLAHLNLTATQKAKESTAYEPAFNYLTVGLELLTEDKWQTQYNLTLMLHSEAAEVSYLKSDYNQTEQFVQTMLEKANTTLDKVKAYEIQIQSLKAQVKMAKALQVGLQALALLGHTFSEEPSPEDIGTGLAETQTVLGTKTPQDLLNLPAMTDPVHLASTRLMMGLLVAAYMFNPILFILLVFKMVQLSIKHGNMPYSAYGYVSYGILWCTAFGDVETGYKFGQLGLNLANKLNAQEMKAKILVAYFNAVVVWKESLWNGLEPLLDSYKVALEVGDMEFANLGLSIYLYRLFCIGENLQKIEQEMALYIDGLRNLKQGGAISAELFWQFTSNLMGQTDNPCCIVGKYFNEEEQTAYLEENNKAYLAFLYVYKAMICYLFNNIEVAFKNIILAEQNLASLAGSSQLADQYLYHALILLRQYPDLPEAEQTQTMEKVTEILDKLKAFAVSAPMNYQHKCDLVEAEQARLQNKIPEAMNFYDQAIELATKNKYQHEAALAYELAGRFYLDLGKTKIAQLYLKDAQYTYLRWGATAKVDALHEQYPELLTKASSLTEIDPTTTTLTPITTTLTTTAGTQSADILDLDTVIKASHAISGEIKLEKLLEKLMNVIIENAGAERGLLVLEKEGQSQHSEARWFIEAEIDLPKTKNVILKSMPAETSNLLSVAIINYVANTKEALVLDDATNYGKFMKDTYIVAEQPKSILCIPLINQGRLTAIIYLENNLATHAFTKRRLELVNLLSAQAAISIENATLYNTLEQRVIERTAQLAEANEKINALNERLQAENLRMEAELDVAKQLQQMLLPTQDELDQIEALDIVGFMQPADEVGGDYYDVLQENGQVKIGIGDVTGHGLKSGVVMLMTQMGIRTLLLNNETDPTRFLNVLNKAIYKNIVRIGSHRNLTLAMLTYKEGTVNISGQHEEVIVVRQNGKIELIDTDNLGFPLGLTEDIANFVNQTSVFLNPGDGIVLYSDGITEAENVNRNLYGLPHLCDVISQNWSKPVQEIKQCIVEDVHEFIGKHTIYDDLTLVVIKQK